MGKKIDSELLCAQFCLNYNSFLRHIFHQCEGSGQTDSYSLSLISPAPINSHLICNVAIILTFYPENRQEKSQFYEMIKNKIP